MIISIYVSIGTINNFNFSIHSERHNSLIKEYDKKYIEDIVITDKNECPPDYTSIIDSYNWNGNYEGCECTESGVSTFYIKANCPSTKCINIEETQETVLNLWRGKNICLKRGDTSYEKSDLLSKVQLIKGNGCPDKKKICGVIDTLDNLLCIDEKLSCPINYMKFIDEADIINYSKNNLTIKSTDAVAKENVYLSVFKNATLKDIILKKIASSDTGNQYNITAIGSNITLKLIKMNEDYKVAQLNDNKYFIYGNNVLETIPLLSNSTKFDKIISVIFRVSLTTPCEDILKKPSADKFTKLVKNNFDFTCDEKVVDSKKVELFDERYNMLDSYSLNQFFIDNSFADQFEKVFGKTSISLNKLNKDKTLKLYSRPYSGYLTSCNEVESINSSNIGGILEFIGTYTMLNQMVISIMVHSIAMIGALVVIALWAFMFWDYYEYMFKGINLGFIVINLIFSVQIISNSNYIINVMTDTNDVYCGDKVTNDLFKDISNACLDVEYKYFVILILSILNALVLIYTVYRIIKPYNQQFQDHFTKYIEMKK